MKKRFLKKIRLPLWSGLLAAFLISGFILPAEANLTGPWDHSLLDQVLKHYVNEAGEVDYAGVKADPEKRLDQYFQKVTKLGDLKELESWPREEVLAFWLNVYHAALLKAVIENYPVKSINDIPGIWDMDILKVGDTRVSLNAILQGQLMMIFKDEKIHLAASLAAKSSPKFPREVFTGPKVEGQLFVAARNFVNDPTYVQIKPGEKDIQLSRIFEWYANDFRLDFGVVDQDKAFSEDQFAVLSFIAHYLSDFEKVQFLEDGHFKIKYIPFDWSLNDWKKTPSRKAA